MWQYVAVVLVVAAAAWYLVRRYRRVLGGRGSGCACGGQEGRRPRPQSLEDLSPPRRSRQAPPRDGPD
jgi:transcription antitermination factor NusG